MHTLNTSADSMVKSDLQSEMTSLRNSVVQAVDRLEARIERLLPWRFIQVINCRMNLAASALPR